MTPNSKNIKKITLGALGDSITAGCNTSRWGDNESHSWSTGSDSLVESHASRLKKLFPESQIKTSNVAVSGSTSSDLRRQTSMLLRGEKLDYVTLLIGSNDLLRFDHNFKDTLDGVFKNVRSSLEQIVQANPATKILVAGLPDLLRLPAVLLKSGLGPLVAQFLNSHPFFSNKDLAQLHKIFLPRWQDINAALASFEKIFPAQVRYCREISETVFDREHLSSLDFFHPSPVGQKLLAHVSWNEDWMRS